MVLCGFILYVISIEKEAWAMNVMCAAWFLIMWANSLYVQVPGSDEVYFNQWLYASIFWFFILTSVMMAFMNVFYNRDRPI